MKVNVKTIPALLVAGGLFWIGGNAQAEAEDRGSGLEVTRAVSPKIPGDLQQMAHEERVILEFTVTEAGTVSDARVLVTRHPELNPYVLAALSEWTFNPKRVEGQAVEARVRLPLELIRRDGSGQAVIVAKR